jgi:regulator of cell morphogenesis and NO signaling
VQLKNIERHIRLLVNDGNAQYMSLIFSLFNEYKEELSSLIGKEESLFLPYVNNVYELFFSPDYQPIEGDVAGALSVFVSEYNNVNEKLDDLKNILIKYIQGGYDENIFYGVIFALDRLQRDINATELIELKVLEPMVAKMEREITERVSKMQGR